MCCVEVGVTVAELTRPRHSRSLCLAWGGGGSVSPCQVGKGDQATVFAFLSCRNPLSLVINFWYLAQPLKLLQCSE